jgi:hypothetical protein
MKSKDRKKLTLNRETIMHLADRRLEQVNGGYTFRCTAGPGCDGGGTSNNFSCDVTICGCESHFCTSGQTCNCV